MQTPAFQRAVYTDCRMSGSILYTRQAVVILANPAFKNEKQLLFTTWVAYGQRKHIDCAEKTGSYLVQNSVDFLDIA